ncbi:MAG: HAMP domain-containing protein [Desulfovibrio sp.]|nr:HAMP domain-containing protein [Desulfovibrio sp.]MBI4958708.1 HAMP domain-containing protein [Desulfovibrio sp.]
MTVSIRTRLLALMLAAALPAMAIMVITGNELEENVVSTAESNALRQVQNMAAHHERIVENARLLLATLAKTSEVRSLDRKACQELLQDIQQRNPVYVSLALADAGGAVLARAPADTSGNLNQNMAQEAFFKQAVSRKEFVTGDYVYLQDVKRVVIDFAQPVLQASGEVQGVLLAAFDLNHFGSLFADAGLPKGAVFTLTDAGGMRLTRFPETDKYTWVPDLPQMIEKMSGPSDEGTFRETGVDGVMRLYGYKRLHFAGAPFPYLMIRLGIPVDEALARARNVVDRNLLMLFVAAVLFMGSAWMLGEVAVVRKLNGLLAAAVRLGTGELGVRSGLAHGRDEIGRLGQAFDSMAQALQQRDRERREAEDEVRTLNLELEERVRLRTSELASANQELTQAMERLTQAQLQLVQSEKMAALGVLVAGVSHEINTPVGISVTAVSFLEEKTRQTQTLYDSGKITRAEFQEFMNTVETSAKIIADNLARASELIRSFKLVAVDQSSEEKRVFRVKEYLDQILLSLRPRLKRTKHTVDVTCDESLEIESYPGVFYQIIVNFVMNSLVHAFPEDFAGRIAISATVENNGLTLVYSDNGLGMDEPTLARIFEPFYTTSRKSGGSGLGLSIVYNLVTRTLGGEIRAASEPGKGTVFTITVPLGRGTGHA